MVQILRDLEALTRWREGRISEGRPVGFVPTMGALHRGHQGLMREACRAREALLVSIFVNPTQFAEGEDFEEYPRNEVADISVVSEVCEDAAIWFPAEEDVYPQGFSTSISVAGLSEPLCGATRAGHFDGVATVVARLFALARPSRAYFGQKDYQQLAVVRRMVADLLLPVEIVGVPTLRAADGLALSSRNIYLSTEERAVAPGIHQAISAADGAWRRGERSAPRLKALALEHLEGAGNFRVDYVEVLDAEELSPLRPGRPAVIAIAVWLGQARLIDNGVLGR